MLVWEIKNIKGKRKLTQVHHWQIVLNVEIPGYTTSWKYFVSFPPNFLKINKWNYLSSGKWCPAVKLTLKLHSKEVHLSIGVKWASNSVIYLANGLTKIVHIWGRNLDQVHEPSEAPRKLLRCHVDLFTVLLSVCLCALAFFVHPGHLSDFY